MSEVLSLAICLFPEVTALDYQGPTELFGHFSSKTLAIFPLSPKPAYSIEITYLSHTLEPVEPGSGPKVLPTRTYDDVKSDEQFDIIFVPGGIGANPDKVSPALSAFIKRQAPGAKYILSVCTGSWVLAGLGLLDGKRATTNKLAFQAVKAATSEKITWVQKARWVVDGKTWTSSGVTAGMDMANAFLIHLVGEDVMKIVRSVVELSSRAEGDDEFADVKLDISLDNAL